MGKNIGRNKLNWKAKLVVAGILAIFAGFIFYIDWIWDTQGQNLALLQISLFIAIIVAIVALWSLKTTRDSLELTRSTTRPFLTSSLGIEPAGDVMRVHLKIENTGMHPADNTSSELQLFDEHNGQERILREKTDTIGIVFMKTEIWIALAVNTEEKQLILNEQAYVRVIIDYKYKLTGTTHRTVQTHKIKQDPLYKGRFIFPIISGKSYWT